MTKQLWVKHVYKNSFKIPVNLSGFDTALSDIHNCIKMSIQQSHSQIDSKIKKNKKEFLPSGDEERTWQTLEAGSNENPCMHLSSVIALNYLTRFLNRNSNKVCTVHCSWTRLNVCELDNNATISYLTYFMSWNIKGMTFPDLCA